MKKKNKSIAYHLVCEDVNRNRWMTVYDDTHNNEADLLMKVLTSDKKKQGFTRIVLRYVCVER